MNLLCELFGHKRSKGYYGTVADRYVDVMVGPTDGIGRVHGRLFDKCSRCGEDFQIGMIHVPKGVTR